MLDRCRRLEIRSAALYRAFAAGARDRELSALWTTMAREAEEHARILDDTRARLPTIDAWLTDVSGGWPEVLRDIEAKLSQAELLAGHADADQQLAAALALEMTDIEPLHQMLRAVSQHHPQRPIAQSHALRLADAADRFSADPQVRRQAALLRARVGPIAHDSQS